MLYSSYFSKILQIISSILICFFTFISLIGHENKVKDPYAGLLYRSTLLLGFILTLSMLNYLIVFNRITSGPFDEQYLTGNLVIALIIVTFETICETLFNYQLALVSVIFYIPSINCVATQKAWFQLSLQSTYCQPHWSY